MLIVEAAGRSAAAASAGDAMTAAEKRAALALALVAAAETVALDRSAVALAGAVCRFEAERIRVSRAPIRRMHGARIRL